MKKTLTKLSAIILISSIFTCPLPASAAETDTSVSQSSISAAYLKSFLTQNDGNRKLAADSLNFNSYWNSAHFLTANDCLSLLIKADGNLVSSSLKANPGLMLTVVNVDVSSHFFNKTDVPSDDNPIIVYQIASRDNSYPLLWAVNTVSGTVYSTQSYPGAAIYELKDNQIIQTYANDNKCLTWR